MRKSCRFWKKESDIAMGAIDDDSAHFPSDSPVLFTDTQQGFNEWADRLVHMLRS